MESNPKVSIIMGAYNCASTLAEAVQSILDQTYDNWELIVCDDGSSDATADLLGGFKAEHPDRIRILRNTANSGLAYSLNQCLSVADGTLIARMDADDRSAQDRIERQVAYLARHPGVDLVGTSMRRFSANGLADVVHPPSVKPDRYSLRHGVPFAHATIIAYRHVYERLGGYVVAPRTRRAQDLDLFFRFFEAGFEGHNIIEPLYYVREDAAAVRRRDFRTRFSTSYLTSMAGYRRLDFPTRWYFVETLRLLKGLVPMRIVDAQRDWQRRSYLGRSGESCDQRA